MQTLLIVKGIRWRHVVLAPFVLVVVLVVAGLLIQLPVLRWGWWTAIGGRQPGHRRHRADQWHGARVARADRVPARPAARRSRSSRRPRSGCSGSGPRPGAPAKRVGKAIQFGLMHAIIGIPIGVALALSIGGGYFMWCYLRRYRATHRPAHEAMMESTRAHATYNVEIVVVLLLAFVTLAITG